MIKQSEMHNRINKLHLQWSQNMKVPNAYQSCLPSVTRKHSKGKKKYVAGMVGWQVDILIKQKKTLPPFKKLMC